MYFIALLLDDMRYRMLGGKGEAVLISPAARHNIVTTRVL